MSERSELINRLLASRESREAYVKGKAKVIIPAQIRALRLRQNMSRQKDLADAAGMKQSQISHYETPGTNISVDLLARFAATFRVGLVIKFVPLDEMLRWDNEFSQDEFNVTPIEEDAAFIAGSPALAKSGRIGADRTGGNQFSASNSVEIGEWLERKQVQKESNLRPRLLWKSRLPRRPLSSTQTQYRSASRQ